MLEDKLRKAGFTCKMCAKCCSGNNNEVMVTPDEIDTLIAATGLTFEEIAEPYPEMLETPDGGKFTFGWILRRGTDGNCMFLHKNRCKVYTARPHICRTYPFMLDGKELIISECDGCGGEETKDTEELAQSLIKRAEAEQREAEATAIQYQKHSNTAGQTIIYDSRGAHTIDD